MGRTIREGGLDAMTDHPLDDATIDGAVGPLKPDDTRRGWPGLCCPLCGEIDVVDVRLEDCSFRCVECDESFTAQDVRDRIEAWTAVLRWVSLAPAVPGQGK